MIENAYQAKKHNHNRSKNKKVLLSKGSFSKDEWFNNSFIAFHWLNIFIFPNIA